MLMNYLHATVENVMEEHYESLDDCWLHFICLSANALYRFNIFIHISHLFILGLGQHHPPAVPVI